MNIDQYSKCLRKLVNESTITGWQNAKNKKAYAASLVSDFSDEIVQEILSDVLNNILDRRAADRFTTYSVGEEVLISGEGRQVAATITERLSTNELRVSLKEEDDDLWGKTMDFHRSRDKIYVNMEGIKFRRLKPMH